MTIEKLRKHEPLFGSWYVDSKLAEGRNSKIFKVYKTVEGVPTFLALKTMKFPSSDRELSRVIESGKYRTVDEYLDMLEETVSENMNKMLSLRTNPHIVRYDNFTIVRESSCFYVIMLMELLYPFSEYVQADNISASQIVKIGSDLCYAVEGFRNAGIMHHQIKPENIYADKDGNFKLGDFGISNVSERIRTEASPYMAPEIYNGLPYDSSSDIYSIGVLLYKLFNNNRLPFLPEYPNPVSLNDRELAFEKQMRGEAMPAPANADSEITRIIFTALSYNQADRYFSPILMRTELDRYLDFLNSSSLQSSDIREEPAPVYTAVPAGTFNIADENDISFAAYQQPTAMYDASSEQAAYRQAFADDEENDDDSDNKKLYIIIAAVIALIGVVAAILFFGLGGKEDKDGTTVPTTLPPTVATTPAPTVETTIPLTVTTTETTTEATTTEPTTTETTTVPTTVTTTAPTTEPTTLPTTEEFTGTPVLVVSNHEDGETSPDGKIYTEITDYTILQSPAGDVFDEVVIDVTTPLGENLVTNGKVFIYEMAGATILQKVEANLSCIATEDNGDISTACFITVNDSEFYYAPDYYQYYVCFEEGAIVSDTVISLPLQIEI